MARRARTLYDGSGGNRTLDVLIKNQMLYQLSYAPYGGYLQVDSWIDLTFWVSQDYITIIGSHIKLEVSRVMRHRVLGNSDGLGMVFDVAASTQIQRISSVSDFPCIGPPGRNCTSVVPLYKSGAMLTRRPAGFVFYDVFILYLYMKN